MYNQRPRRTWRHVIAQIIFDKAEAEADDGKRQLLCQIFECPQL